MEERAKQRAEKKALLEEKRRKEEEYKLVGISESLLCYDQSFHYSIMLYIDDVMLNSSGDLPVQSLGLLYSIE